ncbi:MAG: GLPGLI family protein [Dysgonomonas sp.]
MKHFILYFFLFITLTLNAQIFIPDNGESAKLPPPKAPIVLDSSMIRIQYRQRIINDTVTQNYQEHLMLLQIGSKISKYTDYNKLIGDSLNFVYSKQGMDINSMLEKVSIYTRNGSRENIFTNYPKGKITSTNFFTGSSFLYEEPLIKTNWKSESGNLTVSGYKCKKASTTLFGRKYTAWYAPDIPISNGPWKFSGLPGLILKVEDDKKQISFECIAIEKPRWVDNIYIFDRNYMKTNKKTFLKSYKQYRENPGAALQNSGMIQGDIPAHALRKRAYNPIELSE